MRRSGGALPGPLALVVLLAAATLSSTWFVLPDPEPAGAPAERFASGRASAHLLEIARAAHPTGSPEHDRVRGYLLDQLERLGLEPSVQTATAMVRRGPILRAATVRNVVALVPGTDPTGTILLTAHYDGREHARAAADDGIGVVSILESLRALRTGPPLRNDVILLLTDAEELGLLGARAFAAEHPWMEEVTLALALEMRGGGGVSVAFETGREDGWIVSRFARAATRPFANSLSRWVYPRLPVDTDFTVFREAGVQGLNFAAIGRASLYHQRHDAPARISEATLQHHGTNLLAILRDLGDAELSRVRAPDAVYFRLPLAGLVVYREGLTVPFGVLTLVVAAAAVALAWRRGALLPGVLVGALLAVASVGLAYALASRAPAALARFHPERGALPAAHFHGEGVYILALVAACYALVGALFSLARRRFTVAELASGAFLAPLAATLTLTWLLPAGAPNLQWPTLAGALALAAVSGARGPAAPGPLAGSVALLLALPAAALLVPLVELLWQAASFAAAGWLAALATLALLLILPAMDTLRNPNGWWAPVSALLAAVALAGAGILRAGPSPERPFPSTLVHAWDRGSGEAFWATEPLRSEDPADDAGRAWARERAGAAFDATRSLEAFTGRGLVLPAAPAAPPVAPPPPPTVRVAAVFGEGAGPGPVRTVRVEVRSELGAEVLLAHLPAEEAVELAAVNGKALTLGPRASGARIDGSPGAGLRTLEHWGRPDGALVLEFRVEPGVDTFSFAIVEHLLRPGEILGAGTFRRPLELAPNVTLPTDRAMIRTPVRLEARPGASNLHAPAPEAGGARSR